jgi:4-amino-4-deoxy-L-arabinose transferase-like glycosyltransferase
MTRSLVPPRDAFAWLGVFVLASLLLVVAGFDSDDPDSALYAALSARLADLPPSQWIAPQWWGHWETEGPFREHPAGVFLLPALLGAVGIPGVQAAYIVGLATGLTALLLVGHLVARVTSPTEGRAALVLLQLMPMASIFRIRANHEYPMLVCLLIAIVGVDAVRRGWRWWWIAPLALTAGLLIKGAFVAIPFFAAALWAALNPARTPGPAIRPAVVMLLSVVAMTVAAFGYDQLYRNATGEPFWAGYWERQLGPLADAANVEHDPSFAATLWFYLVRMAWHPAPWSFALVISWWRWRHAIGEWWRSSPESARRGLMFCLIFAVACLLILSTASRFAERYAFSAHYAIAAAGSVVALHLSPGLATALGRLDRAIPAFPAVCWLAFVLMRLALGPYLPRISS